MGDYRKYLEPEYGEVAPEVEILAPQILDMDNAKIWRVKSNYESVSAMTLAYQKCNCYEKIMKIQTTDVKIRAGEEVINARIYMPEKVRKCPVMIFYHGGAFSMNSIDVYEYVCRYMSWRGNIVIVSPDYHLAPEYKFPKGLNEAYDTMLWTVDNISDYGGDENNINVCGDSSGGNFAAVVSIMARDNHIHSINKQILFYPLTTNSEKEMTESEKRYETGYFLEYNCQKDPMQCYFNAEEEKENPLASPLLAKDLSRLPNTCVISAECDPLLDQGLMYAARLEDAGVEVEYHILKGMVHGFLNWTYGESFEAMNYAVEFVRK